MTSVSTQLVATLRTPTLSTLRVLEAIQHVLLLQAEGVACLAGVDPIETFMNGQSTAAEEQIKVLSTAHACALTTARYATGVHASQHVWSRKPEIEAWLPCVALLLIIPGLFIPGLFIPGSPSVHTPHLCIHSPPNNHTHHSPLNVPHATPAPYSLLTSPSPELPGQLHSAPSDASLLSQPSHSTASLADGPSAEQLVVQHVRQLTAVVRQLLPRMMAVSQERLGTMPGVTPASVPSLATIPQTMQRALGTTLEAYRCAGV